MTNQPVTVVVGMGPGLSLAIAERFATAGHRVVGLGRNPGKVAGSVAALHERGLSVELRSVDAGDADRLRQTIEGIERDAGPVEVLVYNAYRADFAPPSRLRPEDAVADFRVNVVGALVAAQAVLPGMRRRGRGTILFTGGGLALDPTGWLDAASLSIGKAGLRNLAQSMNAELAPAGIHVGTVTIAGMIQPRTTLSPENLAEVFWEMYQASSTTRPAERVCT